MLSKKQLDEIRDFVDAETRHARPGVPIGLSLLTQLLQHIDEIERKLREAQGVSE